MNYDLKKPCDNCPFRTDCLAGWLGEERAAQIVESIIGRQQDFPCHKTTGGEDDNGDPVPGKNEQHCAGAMILLEKINRPNQMMRICERLGMYDRAKLDMGSPVFGTPEDFIEHHSEDAA